MNPRRRAGGSTSDQSVSPVTAAPAAPTKPIPIDVSHARANSERLKMRSSASNTIATVQAPTGTSLSTTCRGSPSHVPFKKFLIFCADGWPPPYRALSSNFCSLSSTGCRICAGDEPRVESTSDPGPVVRFGSSICSSLYTMRQLRPTYGCHHGEVRRFLFQMCAAPAAVSSRDDLRHTQAVGIFHLRTLPVLRLRLRIRAGHL